MPLHIVGISAYFHDSACALLRDGQLVAAASEERFSRRKYDRSIPQYAFDYMLREAGLTIADVDCIAYYEDPIEKLERQVWMALPAAPGGRALWRWLDPSRVERDVRDVLGCECPIRIVKHHHAHAASSFYCSGFNEAAVLTVDGVGEWTTTLYGRASRASGLEPLEEVHFPHSLGLLYSALTSYLGFGVNDGEYKVMGLAPYGQPQYVARLEQLLEDFDEGQYRLNLKYFDFQSLDRMYTDELVALLGQPARPAGAQLDSFHADVARSVQVLLERILVEKARYLHGRTGADDLCMAGGVALNCVANTAILRHGPFKRLFVQPAAGDAGGAIGAAMLAHTALAGQGTAGSRLDHVYLGPSYDNDDIVGLLDGVKAPAVDFRASEESLLAATAERLASGKVVGWFHGRMEFGPRALGARSILADPRHPEMRERINALVKKREAFRPFAPAVLWSKAHEHFDLTHPSPFMLETCQVTSALNLPAITHVDGSARVQTVDGTANARFGRLLAEFDRLTGCPILLNTSFNMKDEPIVCSPVDALICFWRSDIDTLVLEDFLLDRSNGDAVRRSLVSAEALLQPSDITHKVYTLV
jgi:carbamoyltransferase